MTHCFENPYTVDTKEYRAYNYLLTLVDEDEEDFETIKDPYSFKNGLALVIYDDSMKEEDVDIICVNVDDY